MSARGFGSLLQEALRDFAEHGYTSESDLQEWLIRLEYALERELPTDQSTRRAIAAALETVFAHELRSGISKRIPGVDRYTLDRIAPELRAELDRRIFASVDLIRLNRKAAVEKTLQRFSGWVSSRPPAALTRKGGTGVRDAMREIALPIAQAKYERRRVAIDQGHKLSSAVSHIAAMGSGAIAAIWHDRGEFDKGYDARPEHLKRSGKLYIVRGSWAMDEGLIRKGGLPYVDSVTQPGEEVYCSCWWEYATNLRDLPETLLTAKGREWVRSAA